MMKRRVFLFFLLAGIYILFPCRLIAAVSDTISVNEMVEISAELRGVEVKLRTYVEEMERVSRGISMVSEKKLEQMEKKISQLSAKHTIYCQAQQLYIAMNDSLMSLVAYFQEQNQLITDSIQVQYQRFQWIEDFEQAERFVASKDSVYKRMLRQSVLLSQVEKTAPALEQLKGREQLVFADIEAQFQKAKVAADATPSLKMRYSKLEEKYIEFKNTSGKIQEATYMPFLERIKDKLMSLAAVGIILMFFNMVMTKIQTYKQMRESAKKMEEMMKKSKEDYPKI